MALLKLSHRRRREGRTDYKTRLALLKSGESRFVVRRSSKNIICQLVGYKQTGDTTSLHADSRELKNFGWNYHGGNLSSAYLTGLLFGVRAKGKKSILDLGLYTPNHGSRLFATLKGAIDGGLDIAYSEDALPPVERFSGKHISDYATLLKKEQPTKYKKVFSGYLKNNLVPEDIAKVFEQAKSNILGGVKVEKKEKPAAEKPKVSKPKTKDKE